MSVPVAGRRAATASDVEAELLKSAAMAARVRDPWLDTLRAAAILAVVLYHSVKLAPDAMRPDWLGLVARHGYLGVDLFFVLSGWLIGGLYWRERRDTGRVQLVRFWSRRWLRTIPPYLVALVVSWAAVFAVRGEPWDWRYLFFAQNYTGINFFKVSWSLCVEEHFYVFAPLVALLAGRPGLLLLVPVAIVARALHFVPLGRELELVTESHMRWDGLVMGFAAAGLPLGPLGKAWCRRALVPLVLLAVVVQFDEGGLHYILMPTTTAIAMLTALIAFSGRTAPASGVARHLAAAAYSVYLTHALMIHLAIVAADRVGEWSYYPAVVAGVSVAGAMFYLSVERPALRLRDAMGRAAPLESRAPVGG